MTKVDLQRVLDLDAQATAGPWESTTEIGGTQADVPEATADAALIAHYRTAAPAMAKALQAVLEIHEAGTASGTASGTAQRYCTECTESYGCDYTYYPCPTVQAIHEHLGEQE